MNRTGHVKWWSEEKGWGFIIPDGEPLRPGDIFVHHHNVKGTGRKSLKDGQRVQFVEKLTAKGYLAMEVEPENANG